MPYLLVYVDDREELSEVVDKVHHQLNKIPSSENYYELFNTASELKDYAKDLAYEELG